MNGIIENNIQCWGCPIFDHLFQVVSNAAAAVYSRLSFFCIVLFCIIFAFFVLKAVWENIKGGVTDPLYQKSIKPVFINSIFALTLLGMGVAFPRFISTITFEPAAKMALFFSNEMLQTSPQAVEEKVTYKPLPIEDDGFFRPELRDTIILLAKTTITQFQAYIKLGIAVMDSAFSWKDLAENARFISNFFKSIILFFLGFYLAYNFFKLFVQFCFFFVDIIIAMTFFAFFFPISLVLLPFKDAKPVPSWVSSLGKNVGADQIKKLINAIVSLVSVTIVFTVIMTIIAKFFSATGQSASELMTLITTGEIYSEDLSKDNLAALNLISGIILVYILNFVYSKTPEITKKLLGTFNVSEEKSLSDKMGKDFMNLTMGAISKLTNTAKTIINKADDKSKEKK